MLKEPRNSGGAQLKNFLFALMLCFAPIMVAAAPLKVVNVGAPAINCVFNTPCTIAVNDTADNVVMSTGGTGSLQSRTSKACRALPGMGCTFISIGSICETR